MYRFTYKLMSESVVKIKYNYGLYVHFFFLVALRIQLGQKSY